MHGPNTNEEWRYISLAEAGKKIGYSQEYLSLRARQKKLRAMKLGRNWVTTSAWVEEYLKRVEEYNHNHRQIEGIVRKNGIIEKAKALSGASDTVGEKTAEPKTKPKVELKAVPKIKTGKSPRPFVPRFASLPFVFAFQPRQKIKFAAACFTIALVLLFNGFAFGFPYNQKIKSSLAHLPAEFNNRAGEILSQLESGLSRNIPPVNFAFLRFSPGLAADFNEQADGFFAQVQAGFSPRIAHVSLPKPEVSFVGFFNKTGRAVAAAKSFIKKAAISFDSEGAIKSLVQLRQIKPALGDVFENAVSFPKFVAGLFKQAPPQIFSGNDAAKFSLVFSEAGSKLHRAQIFANAKFGDLVLGFDKGLRLTNPPFDLLSLKGSVESQFGGLALGFNQSLQSVNPPFRVDARKAVSLIGNAASRTGQRLIGNIRSNNRIFVLTTRFIVNDSLFYLINRTDDFSKQTAAKFSQAQISFASVKTNFWQALKQGATAFRDGISDIAGELSGRLKVLARNFNDYFCKGGKNFVQKTKEIFGNIKLLTLYNYEKLKNGLHFTVLPWQKEKPAVSLASSTSQTAQTSWGVEKRPVAIEEPLPVPEQPLAGQAGAGGAAAAAVSEAMIEKITRELVALDSGTLAKLENRIQAIESGTQGMQDKLQAMQAWQGDIQSIKELAGKIQPSPPSIQYVSSPVYVGSTGIQVGGASTLASLVVSGFTGLSDLGVGNSASIGETSADVLTVRATSNLIGPVTASESLQVGGSVNNLTVDKNGNLTTTGTVSATGGITTSGTLNVGGLTVSGTTTLATTTVTHITASGNAVFNGSVGIGTTTSYYPLSVGGDSYFAGNATTTGAVYIAGSLQAGAAASFTTTTFSGNVLPQTHNLYTVGSSDLRWAEGWFSAVNVGTSSVWSIAQGDGQRLGFFNSASGGNEVLTITSGGNVGIGTTTPYYPFAVSGGSYFAGNTTTTGSGYFAGSVNIGGNLTVGGILTFSTSSTAMATTSISALSVGTSTVANLFTVAGNGNAIFQNIGEVFIVPSATTTIGSSTSTPTVLTGYIASNILPYYDNVYDIGASNYRFRKGYFGDYLFVGTSTAAALYVSGADNRIGVGTSTPYYSFALQGTAGINPFQIASSSGASMMSVNQSGYLGVGVSSPVSLVELSTANTSPVLTITNLSDIDTYDPSIAFRTGSTPATRYNVYLDDSDSDKLKFATSTSGTPALTLTTNNYVGVNNNSPLAMLDVGGGSAIGSLSFGSLGLNDAALSGTYTGAWTQTLKIQIDGDANPNTFKWSIDNGANWAETGKTITGLSQALSYTGVSVTFGATTGHTLNDYWQATLTPPTGLANTAGGYKINGNLFAHTSGTANVWLGAGAGGGGLNTGRYNTALGYNPLYSNTTGYSNNAVGYNALYSNTTGYSNVGEGQGALYANVSGYQNTAVGVNALYNNLIGTQNSAFGSAALYSNLIGSYNTAQGVGALYSNATGSYNVALGAAALYQNATGSYNVALGVNAGYANTIGNYNTFLGYNAGNSGTSANLTNATCLGYECQIASSNALVLGGTGSYGVNVGIGTTTPAALLSVYSSGTSAFPLLRIATSTTEALYVSTAGYVGVGTTTPSSKLSISGTAGSKLLDIGFSSGTSTLSIDGSGLLVISLGDNSSTSMEIKEGANSYLTFDTSNNAEKIVVGKNLEIGTMNVDADSGAVRFVDMAVSASSATNTAESLSIGIDGLDILTAYVEATGNGLVQNKRVGIATSTPIAMLDIVGNASTTGALMRVATSTGDKFFIDGMGLVGIGTSSPVALLSIRGGSLATAPLLRISTSTLEAMYIDATGKIGIGTTTPVYSLDILARSGVGSLRIASSSAYNTLSVDSSGLIAFGLADNSSTSLAIQEGVNAYLTFDTSNDAEKIVVGKNLEIGTTNVDADSGAVQFVNMNITASSTVNTAESLSVALDGVSVLTVYGEADGAGYLQNYRVGIGTTTPIAMLTVIGSASSSASSLLKIATSTGTAMFIDGMGLVGIGTSTPYASFDLLGKAGVHPFRVSSSTGSTLLTVMQNGNIGIGTSTPYATFDLLGFAGQDPFRISSSSGAVLFSIDQNGFIQLRDNASSSLAFREGTTDYLTFDTSNGAEKIVVGKNLEIGTTNVDADSGAVNFVNMDITASSTTSTVESLSIALDGNSVLTAYGESAGHAGTLQNLRVGIGTTTPVAMLSVAGNAYSTGPLLRISTSTTEALFVDVSGSVGIGTSTPYTTLDIKGISAIDPLRVASSSGVTLLALNQNGYLGIATSTPYYPLTVWGSAAFGTGTTPTLYVDAGTKSIGINNDTSLDAKLDIQLDITSGTIEQMSYESAATLAGNLTGLDMDLSTNVTPGSYNITGINVELPSGGTGSNVFARFLEGSSELYNFNSVSAQFNVPASFNAAGDVSLAYDLIMTNNSAGYVKFQGPGYIQTEDASGNYDLTLSAANSGDVVISDNLEISTTSYAVFYASRDLGTVGIGTSTAIAQLSIISDGSVITKPLLQVATSSYNALVVDANGRIGIGTSTPLALLSIRGDTASSSAPLLRISTSTTEALYIDSAGKIGMGTTSPASRLSISGTAGSKLLDIGFSSGTSTLSIDGSGLITFTLGDNSSTSMAIQEGTNAYLTFDTSNDAEKIVVGKNLEIGTMNVDADSGSVQFVNMDITASSTTSTAEKLSIALDQQSILTVYGEATGNGMLQNMRVGIATSTPIAMLDIVGNASTTGALMRVATSTGDKFFIDGMGLVGIGTSSPVALLSIRGGSLATAPLLRISTSTLEAMYIDATGKIGIGTTTPTTALLDIYGTANPAQLRISTSTGWADFYVDNNGYLNIDTINSTTSALQITNSSIVLNQPLGLNMAGDLGLSYDLLLENPSASYVKFAGAGYVQTESPFGNYNLTLAAANTGKIVLNDNVQITGTTQFVASSTVQALATTTAIVQEVTLTKIYASSSVIISAAPTIADGSEGDIIVLLGASSTQAITVQDQDTLASSNLQLGSTSRVLTNGSSLALMFDGTDWVELWYSGITHADFAEMYKIKEDVEAGDVVAFSDEYLKTRKAGLPDQTIAGIISASPAYLIGNEFKNEMVMPVALSGRVPVKVSLEAGAIQKGDLLVLSTKPGYAMKYNEEYLLDISKYQHIELSSQIPIVGVALEDYATSYGKVQPEFLNVEYKKIAIQFRPQADEAIKNTILAKYKINSDNEIRAGYVESLSADDAVASVSIVGSRTEKIANPDYNPDKDDKIMAMAQSGYVKLGPSSGFSKLTIVEKDGKLVFEPADENFADTLDMAVEADGSLVVGKLKAKQAEIGTAQKPAGITIYDEDTGQPYCLKMKAGAMISTAGKCSENSSKEGGSLLPTGRREPPSDSAPVSVIPSGPSAGGESQPETPNISTSTPPNSDEAAAATAPTTEPVITEPPIVEEPAPVPEPAPEPAEQSAQ